MNDDLRTLAGEYVLGTLDADERRSFERRMASSEELSDLVQEWQERLAPLSDLAGEVEPGPLLWRNIERSVDALVSAEGASSYRRIASRWKIATAANAAIAASLAGFIVYKAPHSSSPPPQDAGRQEIARASAPDRASGPRGASGVVTASGVRDDRQNASAAVSRADGPARTANYIAALAPEASRPVLVARLDTVSNVLMVAPIGVGMPQDRRLALWWLGSDQQPRLIAIVTGPARLALPAGLPTENMRLAASFEPQNDRPPESPTLPFASVGQLVREPAAFGDRD